MGVKRVLIRAYLAGPDVFLINGRENERKKKSLCESIGLTPLYPLDNEIDSNLSTAAKNIYGGNLDMLDNAHIVLANISPFRGPHTDPGTAYEMGYAKAKGKPVYGYTNDTRQLIERINEGYPDTVSDGQTSIEQFGLGENLMISESLMYTEFKRHDSEDLTAMLAFEDLIGHLGSHFEALRLVIEKKKMAT